MVNENDLRTIIAQVLQEMNLDSKKKKMKPRLQAVRPAKKNRKSKKAVFLT